MSDFMTYDPYATTRPGFVTSEARTQPMRRNKGASKTVLWSRKRESIKSDVTHSIKTMATTTR
jgi:hypothetical protein